ncbi:prostaglandin-E synthase [Cardiosporidium cionae]|uniref:Prostaglandin E synthase 2 n=1 Tax=Cardiosporidium cionae TaxID=476202 RepID=A0ABQ7J7E6_9APIC|nr:prostaglandin-E synthase [Cardiosporidium cionae]|eukprot:KAF8819912.1 prostaglandin-E synthase [Cardiosporidium cionae]
MMTHYVSLPFRSTVLLAVGASSSMSWVYSMMHRSTGSCVASDSTELYRSSSQLGRWKCEDIMENDNSPFSSTLKEKEHAFNFSTQSDVCSKDGSKSFSGVKSFASSLNGIFRLGVGEGKIAQQHPIDAGGLLTELFLNRRLIHSTAYCQTNQAIPVSSGSSISSFPKASTDLLSELPPYPADLNASAKKVPYNMELLEKIRASPNTEPLIPKELDLRQTRNTLYQYDSCPFCRKVRCCLDLYKIPYQVVEVHPIFKKEVKFSPDYKKVPLLVIQSAHSDRSSNAPSCEEISKDASAIILKDSKIIVHSLMKHEGSILTDSKAQDIELAWIKWTDTWLVQLIVMNIYRTLSESATTFAYLLTHPSFSFYEKYLGVSMGTFIMWLVSYKKRKQYAVTNEREDLYNALNLFVDAVGAKKFHGGEKPNACDIAVFGILRSIHGFQCEEDVFKGSNIGTWYEHMQDVVGPSSQSRDININKTKVQA